MPYRSEFRYGSFSRRIPLPVGTGARDVIASHANGIVEVRIPLPKSGDAARRVPVVRTERPRTP